MSKACIFNWKLEMMQIFLFLLAPLIGIVYSVLEHFGIWDRVFARKQALEGLHRLRNSSGYTTTWIYDDAEDKESFEALFRRIKKYTE